MREALRTLVPEAAPRVAPWSVSPPDTVDALLRLGAYVLLGLAAAAAFRERRHRKALAVALAGCGAFEAVYGVAEYVSGRQHIFGYAKLHFLGEATGTFINRNHFAGFLAMALPFALALASRQHGAIAAPSRGLRRRLVSWTRSSGPNTFLAGFAAICIWGGILLSYSRTGLVAALGASAAFAILTKARRSRWLLLVAPLAVPAIAMLWLEVRAPGERLATLKSEVASSTGRPAVWRTCLDLVREQPLLGHGLGAFESAYSPRQTAAARGRYDHAHNDWLESLVEGGLPALAAVAALLVLSLRAAFRSRAGPGQKADLVVQAAGAALVAIAVHSAADFCLRIPAIAALTAALVGMLAGAQSIAPAPGNVAAFPGGARRTE